MNFRYISPMDKNLYKRVEETLSSNIGSALARGALVSQYREMGITPEELDCDNLEELARKIDEVFTVFYGKETGEYLFDQLMKLTCAGIPAPASPAR